MLQVIGLSTSMNKTMCMNNCLSRLESPGSREFVKSKIVKAPSGIAQIISGYMLKLLSNTYLETILLNVVPRFGPCMSLLFAANGLTFISARI